MILVTMHVHYAESQEAGLRLGDGNLNYVAIDGVFRFDQFNRIHADISFYKGGFGVDALWDFIFEPLGPDFFRWYAGAGPYMGFGSNYFALGAKGELGVEYRFNMPISLGIDWRPGIEIVDKTSFHWQGFAVNVRYVFGEL